MTGKLLSIGEVANLIGVSIDTLRRWDKEGKLPAMRPGRGTHRFYRKSDIQLFITDTITLAKNWVSSEDGYAPEKTFHCLDYSTFCAQLKDMHESLQRIPALNTKSSLITSLVAEIGTNSFDHNLGNWPDIQGIFFSYDINKKIIVLADRGQGILQSLNRAGKEITNHGDAIYRAFDEFITGRYPEDRGIGLKAVKAIVEATNVSLTFFTGNARLELNGSSDGRAIVTTLDNMYGCLALIRF